MKKMSEIIEVFTGIKISRQSLFDIIDKNFNDYATETMKKIQKEFKKLVINPEEAVQYDEEFI